MSFFNYLRAVTREEKYKRQVEKNYITGKEVIFRGMADIYAEVMFVYQQYYRYLLISKQ